MMKYFKPLSSTMSMLGLALLFLAAVPRAWAQDEDIADIRVTDAVDDALIDDQGVPAGFIDVVTQNGIVTLSGSVGHILGKERAAKVAATVKGVRGIINRIQVNAPHRPDNAIQEDVNYALLTDPVSDAYEVKPIVRDAEVTVEGTVDSWQERTLVGKIVSGVSGVKDVDNRLTVDARETRADTEIKKEIEGVLKWDAYVDDAMIDVTVDAGRVQLAGVVGSLAEKRRAEADARVAGVTSVDTTDLDVKWWRRDDRLRRDKYVLKSDDDVQKAVEASFLYDPRVRPFDIQVQVDKGRVTLRGNVDNLKAKRAAASDARGVVGVYSVNNKIKVRPNTPSDSRIKSNVQEALRRDPYVERYDLTVNVVDGEVYLYGDVGTTFEKSQADDIAARQVGVTRVHNFLVVNNPELETYDPYSDDWYLYEYDWYAQPDVRPRKTDWQLAEDIRIQLYWSPFVNREDITVQVEDGNVTLSGSVDTWTERKAAIDNAHEAGATSVKSNITVDNGPEYYRK